MEISRITSQVPLSPIAEESNRLLPLSNFCLSTICSEENSSTSCIYQVWNWISELFHTAWSCLFSRESADSQPTQNPYDVVLARGENFLASQVNEENFREFTDQTCRAAVIVKHHDEIITTHYAELTLNSLEQFKNDTNQKIDDSLSEMDIGNDGHLSLCTIFLKNNQHQNFSFHTWENWARNDGASGTGGSSSSRVPLNQMERILRSRCSDSNIIQFMLAQ